MAVAPGYDGCLHQFRYTHFPQCAKMAETGGGGWRGEAMVRDIYDRTANLVAHLGAWGLEQVGHGLEAVNKRLSDSQVHDAGSDDPSVKRPRGSRRNKQKSGPRKGR